MYIIGEAGSNYNGSFDQAKNLIKIAHDSGVDSCKFQMIYTDELYLTGKHYEYGNYDIDDVLSIRRSNEFPIDVWDAVFNYGKSLDLDISFSIFGEKSLSIASEKFNSKYIKLASCDIKFLELVEKTSIKCKENGKFIIFSTGMSSFIDIENAFKVANKHLPKNKIVILYCVSAYPSALSDINISKIELIKKTFDCEVGFSDHTQSNYAACAAYGAGARWFEKHFTSDKSLNGLDHKYALDYQELKDYVDTLKALDTGLSQSSSISDKELYTANRAIRGIYASREIKKGEIIKRTDFKVVRPKTSISPSQISLIIGKKCNRDITKNQILELNYFI